MGKAILIGVFIVLTAWIAYPRSGSYLRQSIVLASSPVVVFSWDTKTLTLVLLPADIAAEGTRGYGIYTLEAFWKLGEIERKDRALLEESVGLALGIPTSGYIGPSSDLFDGGADAVSLVKSVFSPPGLLSYITGKIRTNLSVRDFVRLVWLISVQKPDHITLKDLSNARGSIAQDLILPDGSHQWVLDTKALDVRLEGVFQDEQIRREGVTVAVYNTTDTPLLAELAARVLDHIGVSVVSVGNTKPTLEKCSVTGSDKALGSLSAKTARAILGCESKEATESGRADILLSVGNAYARQFQPQ